MANSTVRSLVLGWGDVQTAPFGRCFATRNHRDAIGGVAVRLRRLRRCDAFTDELSGTIQLLHDERCVARVLGSIMWHGQEVDLPVRAASVGSPCVWCWRE